MTLQFTAHQSLGRTWLADRAPKQANALPSGTDDRRRVLPQLTVTGCGSALLNTTCRVFAVPAWLPCEISFGWNQGIAGGCMYWSMVGANPGCFRCTVIAP
jgi:hypothetical protein